MMTRLNFMLLFTPSIKANPARKKIEGKERPGRPKTTWLSNIKTWLQLL